MFRYGGTATNFARGFLDIGHADHLHQIQYIRYILRFWSNIVLVRSNDPELGIPLQQHSSLLPCKLINTTPYRLKQQFTLAVHIGWIFSHSEMYKFFLIFAFVASQVWAQSSVYSVVGDGSTEDVNKIQTTVQTPPNLIPLNGNNVYDQDFLIRYLYALKYADLLSNYYFYPLQSRPTYYPPRPTYVPSRPGSGYPVDEKCKQIGEPVR